MVLYYGSGFRNERIHRDTLENVQIYNILLRLFHERCGGLRSGMRRTALPSLRA